MYPAPPVTRTYFPFLASTDIAIQNRVAALFPDIDSVGAMLFWQTSVADRCLSCVAMDRGFCVVVSWWWLFLDGIFEF